MNREPSPDRLTFQIVRTTISLNYSGEEFETLDREVLVISADVPPQDAETDEHRVERGNANADRATRQQQELTATAPTVGQHAGNGGQDNDNIGMQALTSPANNQPHQQHEPRGNHLCARDLLNDFERDGYEVYNSPQANLEAALAALNQLEDTPTTRRLHADVRVATAQIEERGHGYSRSAASYYSRSRSECPRQRRRSNDPLEPVVEEG
jgi:hypothetical protein